MKTFFQTLGYGALYIVASPLIALILVFYTIYCFFVFIVQAVRTVFVYFSGGTVGGDLPEDIEAKKILLEKQRENLAKENESKQPSTQNIFVFNGQPQPAPNGVNVAVPNNPQVAQATPSQVGFTAPGVTMKKPSLIENKSDVKEVEVSSKEGE